MLNRIHHIITLFCGILILVICIYGFVSLQGRLDLPPETDLKRLFKEDQPAIFLDGIKIEHEKDLEFILSQKRRQGELTILLTLEGQVVGKQVSLIPYYSLTPFPLIYLAIGIIGFVIGFTVFLLRPKERQARIFYWASLAFCPAVIISGGFHCLGGNRFSYLPGILFYLLYPLVWAFLLHFAFSFTKSLDKKILVSIYAPALLFILGLESTFLYSSLKSSITLHRIYQSIFYVFRFYILAFVLASISQLGLSLKKAAYEVPRAQIKWILFGLFVGLGPFILLYQVPQVFRFDPLISEDLSSLFFVFVPLAFAIAIVKFKLMNIELLIHRSLVYGFLTTFIVSLYIFLVFVFQNLFSTFIRVRETAIYAFAAVAAAAVFHPARKKIQDFVDRSFYRLSYDYKKTILNFNEKAQKMISQDHLVNFFLIKMNNTLPSEHIGISVYSPDGKRPLLQAQTGEKKNLEVLAEVAAESGKIVARKGALSLERDIDFSFEAALKEKNIDMILPFVPRSGSYAGFLSLGKKMSGEKFSRDDLELIQTMTGELILNLERVRLQEEVIFERAEKDKLDELNRLKTEFISTVSHELRTPMSSIRGLTEVLQEGKIKDKAKNEEIIRLVASESSRLTRLLHNILDFGRIEQREKTYDFQNIEIRSIIEEVIKLFAYILEKDNFILRTHFPKAPLRIKGDEDALKQALINLLDNAIKYSVGKKEIDIEVIEIKNEVEIRVKDRGIGIPVADQEKIFDQFYRHPEASRHRPKGVGLGLKIVKHIMDAHHGEIRVDSQHGKGSTFILILPKT